MSRTLENQRASGKQSRGLIVQILTTLHESVRGRKPELRSNIRFIIITTVLQTTDSYPAMYGPIQPLAPDSRHFSLNNFRLLLKLQSTLKGQEFEDNEEVQKNMTSALKEFHEFSKQLQYR
jgi:hypothetical protein